MDKEQLAKTFANLSTEQRADIMMAIVCGITWKKIPWRTIYSEKWEELPFKEELTFTSDMISVLTAVLSLIR